MLFLMHIKTGSFCFFFKFSKNGQIKNFVLYLTRYVK